VRLLLVLLQAAQKAVLGWLQLLQQQLLCLLLQLLPLLPGGAPTQPVC
jgi:hypothetical protein